MKTNKKAIRRADIFKLFIGFPYAGAASARPAGSRVQTRSGRRLADGLPGSSDDRGMGWLHGGLRLKKTAARCEKDKCQNESAYDVVLKRSAFVGPDKDIVDRPPDVCHMVSANSLKLRLSVK